MAPSPTPHTPRREFINNEFEWYVQDQWKLSQHVTDSRASLFLLSAAYEKTDFRSAPTWTLMNGFKRDRGALRESHPTPTRSVVCSGRKANKLLRSSNRTKNNSPTICRGMEPVPFKVVFLHKIFVSQPVSDSIRRIFYSTDRTGGTFPVTADLSGSLRFGYRSGVLPPEHSITTAPRFTGLQNLTSIPVPQRQKRISSYARFH